MKCEKCGCFSSSRICWTCTQLIGRFTLNEVMDAVKDAFGKVGGETARDCVVEQTIKETLSARPEHKEVFNESGREKLRNDGKRRTTKP